MIIQPAAFASLIAACVVVCDAEPQPEQFSEWWVRATGGGVGGPTIDLHKLTFMIEDVYVPPPAELAAMRQRVAGHPEHRERPLLEQYEARLKGRLSRTSQQLWRLDGGWRISRSWDREAFPYWDFVCGDGNAWQLTRDRLTVFDARAEAPETVSHLRELSDATYSTVIFANLGASAAIGSNLELKPRLLPDGTTWRVDSVGPCPDGQLSFRASGTWDQGLARGKFVESVIQRTNSDGLVVEAHSFTAEQWTPADSLGLVLCAKVVERNATGSPSRVFFLESIDAFTPSEFRALCRVPDANGVDEVRGKVTFRSVMDFRPGSPIALQEDADGRLVPAESHVRSTLRIFDTLRIVGWVTASGLVGVLLWLRLRRR